jgi:hypothetical protein
MNWYYLNRFRQRFRQTLFRVIQLSINYRVIVSIIIVKQNIWETLDFFFCFYLNLQILLLTRVARWYIFIPKSPIWVNFCRVLERKRLLYSIAIWNVFNLFVTCSGHLAIKWQFGIFSHILVYCVKINLATLLLTPWLQIVRNN